MVWERGLWRPGLTLLCCKKILKQMPDFRLETSELANLWLERGYGFKLGVKCHPEMAGCGIEYCWGKVCACVRVRVCTCVSLLISVLFVFACLYVCRRSTNFEILSTPNRPKETLKSQMS